MYKDLIDEALRKVREAKDLFRQKSNNWDDDWCLDKFELILDQLEIVRDFLEG